MNNHTQNITVFEHESLRFDKGEKRITEELFKALQNYYGDGIPYYDLIYNGVRFNEHVGVIQIGKIIIEVLPKADKNESDENKWRDILIGMLKAVGIFDVRSTSNSTLKVKPNTILDLYLEMFINEVEYLLHNGLIKQYRKKPSNTVALKGSLQFAKHIQNNLTHKERFYVNHIVYDFEHNFHFILYKTIRLIKSINSNTGLNSRIGALLLHFPVMEEIKVTSTTFERLSFNRKNLSYKKAINIAKLLLLQYHPDVKKGKNNVLALMFDMNKLWEKFVYVSLRKHKPLNSTILPQSSKFFWQPKDGYRSSIRPDIVLYINNTCLVLDTKWKNLFGKNPSPEDLKQMYVYHKYYGANSVALVYPGPQFSSISGVYLNPEPEEIMEMECSLISLSVNSVIKEWQHTIYNDIGKWFLKLNI